MSKLMSAALVAITFGLASLAAATAAEQLDCKVKVACSWQDFDCSLHAKGLCPKVSA
jgi:hypothetical protein